MSQVPRWMILLALVFAPWAYGSTRPWAVHVLGVILGVTLVLWLLDCLVRRTWPEVPPVLACASVWLLLQAWGMVFNAKYDYLPDASTVLGYDLARRVDLSVPVDWAPGSFHKALSLPAAVQISVLLGVCCFICDLARHSEWRKRLLWTMALTGLSVVMLGLAQRFTNANSIFWQAKDLGPNFFATFRYHANAGAYMNLAWPIFAGLLAVAFTKTGGERRKYLLAVAAIVCLAGVLVNTSRAASGIALALLLVWGVWVARQIFRDRLEGINPASAIVTMALLLLLSGAVAAFTGFESAAHRWQKIHEMFSAQNPRWLTAMVCWDMLPEGGWFGFGPGTFQTLFPFFTSKLGNAVSGVWLYAHNDYLQTLVEWGWLGGLAWAMILFGGVVKSWRQNFQQGEELPFKKRALHFGLFTAMLGVLLHAAVDFPLQVASIQLYVAVMLGLLWGSHNWLFVRRQARTRKNTDEDANIIELAQPAEETPSVAAERLRGSARS